MSQVGLPKGWVKCQLKDIISVNPKVIANDEDLSGFIPMSHAPVSFFDTFKYDERNWGEIKKKYTNFADGDVIFAKVTPCFENGKAALLEGLPNGIGAGSSEFYVLRPLSSTILSKYVFSIIKSAEFLTNGERSMTGAVGLRRVPRSFVENFEVNLPPLAEQQVIADKLDTLLAQVESIKACLERIPDILKQFRQSVLAAAVTGKLTEEWRKNNKIPLVPRLGKEKFKKTLFETALSTLPELPITWEIIPAASVLEYVTSGSRGWSNYYSTSGALFLRMSNVRYDTTKLDLEDLQYVDLPENVEGKRSLVKKDDLLVSITADVGRVARVDKDFKEAYVNQHLALLRPTNEINAEFLATCIASQNIGVKQVSELKRGATKAGLGLDDIRSLAIPFPTLEEQDEIVRQVELLLGNSDVIEKQVQSASDQVNNLTQSILAKAFRGELTAEWREANPELISGENSAEALLERIKAERSAKSVTKPGRGKA